jgi:hypothetical protein
VIPRVIGDHVAFLAGLVRARARVPRV